MIDEKDRNHRYEIIKDGWWYYLRHRWEHQGTYGWMEVELVDQWPHLTKRGAIWAARRNLREHGSSGTVVARLP